MIPRLSAFAIAAAIILVLEFAAACIWSAIYPVRCVVTDTRVCAWEQGK